MITPADGKTLLLLARDAIKNSLKDIDIAISDDIKNKFGHPQGCFVTIHKKGKLRGCIGYPEPVYPLYKALTNAAMAAAFEDPRFPPLREAEYPDIALEISVLTVPEQLIASPSDLPKKIVIGKHGLIIRTEYSSGLLLPQVATEWKMNPKDFLDAVAEKAGLSADEWMDADSKIFTFEAQIFSEESHGRA
jgi:uncharacterized protein